MECWRHPGVAATGVCVSCGRAGCRECLALDGRALKCPDCAAGAPQAASSGGDRRNLASGILAAAFGLAGGLAATLDPTFPKTPAPLLAFLVAFYAYAGWATAWTFPPLWRWLKQRTLTPLLRRLRQDYRGSPLGQLGVLLGPLTVLLAAAVLLYFMFMAALLGGILYGTFGGGIREYLLWRSRFRTEGAGAAAQRTP